MHGRKAVGAGGTFAGRADLQKVSESEAVPPDRYQIDTESICPSPARCDGQETPESSFSATMGKEEIRKQKLL